MRKNINNICLIVFLLVFFVCKDNNAERKVDLPIITNIDEATQYYKSIGAYVLDNNRTLQIPSRLQITNEILQYLKFIPNLEILTINSSKITDDGVENMSCLLNLTTLHLICSKINGEGLKYLKNLKKLELLNLNNTQVTDAGLQYIQELNNLEELSLVGTKITDDGLKYLKNLIKLKSLYLDKTEVTDEGLKHLESIDSLQYLSFKGKVTAAGIERLQKKLPNCTIEN